MTRRAGDVAAIARTDRNRGALARAARAMRQAMIEFDCLAEDGEISQYVADEWRRQAEACRLCAEALDQALAMMSGRGGD